MMTGQWTRGVTGAGAARWVAAALLFVLAVWGGAVMGGDFHSQSKGNLRCSDCHTMHNSYAGSIVAPGTAYGQGAFRKLLKAATVTDTCLLCHGAGSVIAPDVENAVGYVPAAGSFKPGGVVTEGNRHSLGQTFTPSQIPGYTGTTSITLTCVSCHDPHGNPYYRNLTTKPGAATNIRVTYGSGPSYTPPAAIWQALTTPISSHYAVANIQYRQILGTVGPPEDNHGLPFFCGGCHGNFHGPGGSANMGGAVGGDAPPLPGSPWLRHPSRDVTMAQAVSNGHVSSTFWFGGLASRLPVISVGGVIPGTSAASDNQVFCGSCHKAHGSTNKSNLIYDDPTTPALQDGATLIQSCQQCHYQ